jgi:ketosteroid isomerase-like protein
MMTEQLLTHHNKAFDERDMAGILNDYTADAILATPDGVLGEHKQIKGLFEALFVEFNAPSATFTPAPR